MICTPELSSRVSEGVKTSKYATNNGTQTVCLGDVEGMSNLFELMKDVNEEDASEPVTIEEHDKEKMMIFWSSGTTGKFLCKDK